MRAAMNAIFYLLGTGCGWRYLPRDSFPPRSTVYNISRKFQRDGVWEAIRVVERFFLLVRTQPASRQGLREPCRNPGRLRCPRLNPACPQATCQGVDRQFIKLPVCTAQW
jgi:transposase